MHTVCPCSAAVLIASHRPQLAGGRRYLDCALFNFKCCVPTVMLPYWLKRLLLHVCGHAWLPSCVRPAMLPPPQVPLGARFDRYIDAPLRFNIDMAAEKARQLVANRTFETMVLDPKTGRLVPGKVPAHVGMVIDLTNSTRYYDAEQWIRQGIKYIKASQLAGLWHRKGALRTPGPA